ncbi:MAG: hypothetical protein HYR71_09240, partial [Chloroflexi bacterium]|nr:hypothetical protein [Chloroflexota bacterium]
MTQSFPDPAERLVKRERLFVWLRYGALALFAALLAVDPQEPSLTPTTLSVIGAGFVLNTLIWPALYVRRLAKALAAVSAAGDALFLLYFLISSGGGHSPLWSFVFVLIAAMSLRFGTVGGVGTAVVFGALTLVYGMGASDTAPVTLYQSVVRALSFVTLAVVVGWLLRHEHAHTLEEVEEARQAVQRSQSDVAGFAMLSGTISANTSYSLALEQALDLSLRGLRVRGQGEQDALGFILLFDPNDQETLFVAVHRNLDASDAARRFTRVRGQLKTVLETGEPAIVTDTSREPVLAGLTASKTCPTMVIMPLRAGFTLFGVAIIGGPAGMPEAYSNRRELLAVYCAQAGIALQSAQLYEQLRQERDRIVDSEEKARHELARDLHDGPVNAVASLTMGLDFARRLLAENPAEAKQEIDSLHQLAAKTAREMRMTMYRLRPLALESAGLTAALDQYLSRLQAERAQPQFH